MRFYIIAWLVFSIPALVAFIPDYLDWKAVKEKWNKDSVEERAAAKKAKRSLLILLGMTVWFLTVPAIIVYSLIRMFVMLNQSENKGVK